MANAAKSLTPQFVTQAVDEGESPQSISRIASLETYLVQYKDGNGEEGVRIVFKVPGSDAVLIMKDATGGTRIVANATRWFKEEFNKKLTEKGAVNKPQKVGDEGVGAF